ncbi:MAG: SIMPL domain-containing protein [Phototrophicaceae bacterium]
MQMHKVLMTALLLMSLLGLIVPTTLAQEDESMPNTITVNGNGTSSLEPNMATLSVGVEKFGQDILSVYQDVNSTIAEVMSALETLGIEDADMRTIGLDVYVSPVQMGGMESQNETRISNRINIIIRDLSQIETVIDTAINNGANSVFGLQFGISDTSILQSEARTNALADARNRAEEIASNLGVELGAVLHVTELQGGNFGFQESLNAMMDSANGGAVVEPGQVSVSLTMQVTYRFDN